MKLKLITPFNKIFNKLLLTSSLTTILTVTVLIITISNYYSDVIIQRELDLNLRTLERVDDYFSNKDADINNMIRDLYERGDLILDISYALHNKYEDYIRFNLDNYTESSSFVPKNINTYFNGYFKQDEDINAVSLRAIEFPSTEYLYVYNYSRWNNSIHEVNATPNKYNNSHMYNIDRRRREVKDTIIKKVSINNPSTLEKMGELSIYYSTEGLKKIIENHNAQVQASIVIMDNEDKVLYPSSSIITSIIVNNLPNKINGNTLKWQKETYYINTLVKNNEYTYVGVIPKKELNKLTLVQGTMWLLILLSIISAITITYTFMRNYSFRIKQIESSIQQVHAGNLDIRIPESEKEDELSTIAISFNSMLDELNDYIERVYVLNIKQQQAELKALQAQINPHFLFNTLEVIRMTAVVEGSKTSSKMIYHLSRLLRYSLESKEMVPLDIEIENAKQYLLLMQLHHPNKLIVDINIPKELENIPIQKLILQPIIENYMVHGFRKDRTDNYLEIQAIRIENTIEICIRDNGSGMTEEKLKMINDHINNEEGVIMNSIGLINVSQRLKLKHGKQFGLSIQSKQEQETTITISIPIGDTKNV